MSINVLFDSVSLLVDFDGADGATTALDRGPKGKTLTAAGGAKLTTTGAKFGTACATLDGTGDYFTTTSNLADFRFGAGDFTVAAWVNTATGNKAILDFWDTSPGCWQVFTSSTGALQWWTYSGSADVMVAQSTGIDLRSSTWRHIAASRASGTLRLFVDHALVATATDYTNYNNTSVTSFSIGAQVSLRNGQYDFNGKIDDVLIDRRAWYTNTFPAPTEAYDWDRGGWIQLPTLLGATAMLAKQDVSGLIYVLGPLGQPALTARQDPSGVMSVHTPLGSPQLRAELRSLGWISVQSMLSAERIYASHDFYDFLSDDPRHFYTMRLETSGGPTRVPISSWQATLHVEGASFVQCVVPTAYQWVDQLGDAESFVIFRKTTLLDGREIEAALASAPLQTLTFAQGGFNSTATLQGYLTDLALNPDAIATPTLRNVQTVFTYADGIRVRCAIDWQLRPGMTCYYGTTPVVVEYINYYVTQAQAYMDVGGA